MVTPITQTQVGSAIELGRNDKSEVKTGESQKIQSRAEEIKESIARGTYAFDIEKTAKKVAEELL